MATKWSELPQDEKDQINAKRREQYNNGPADAKAAKQAAARDSFAGKTDEAKEARNAKRRKLQCTGHPEIDRLIRKVGRRKMAFQRRMDRIMEWRKSGAKFPWPNLQDKMELTERYMQVLHTLERRCSLCKTHKCFDFSWRITRRDDLLAFVPFSLPALKQVLLHPKQYEIFCHVCAFNVKLWAFAWIFSPKSLSPFPHTQAEWNARLATMYPKNRIELYQKIDQGTISSLIYKQRLADGKYHPTFLRKNHWYDYTVESPRDLCLLTCEAARRVLNLEGLWPGETCFYGAGTAEYMHIPDNILSPQFKEWLVNEVSPKARS